MNFDYITYNNLKRHRIACLQNMDCKLKTYECNINDSILLLPIRYCRIHI